MDQFNIVIFRANKKMMSANFGSMIVNKNGDPKNLVDVQSKFGIAMKYAQSVGENKASAKFLIKLLKGQNIPVIEVAPSKRDRADKAQEKAGKLKIKLAYLKMATKSTADQFNEYTGWKGRSNEHSRDAGTLVFGRTIRWAEMQVASQERKNRP